MKEVFWKGAERSRGDHEGEIRDLHVKIGELTAERGQLSLRRRHVRLHQPVDVVGNALRRFAEPLHRPVRGIALGHVARPRLVHQTLGQLAPMMLDDQHLVVSHLAIKISVRYLSVLASFSNCNAD